MKTGRAMGKSSIPKIIKEGKGKIAESSAKKLLIMWEEKCKQFDLESFGPIMFHYKRKMGKKTFYKEMEKIIKLK